MNEKLFNLLLFVMGDIIHEIGALYHERTGGDRLSGCKALLGA